jgi:hypothetical protein
MPITVDYIDVDGDQVRVFDTADPTGEPVLMCDP